MTRVLAVALVVLPACGAGHNAATDASGSGTGDGSDPGPRVLADNYPGDVGLGGDPAVVWFEDFEEGSVLAITTRYDQAQGQPRMQVVSDHAGGAAALALTAGNGVQAVDLYKQLPDHADVFVRWYAKYQANIPWHHSGVWFG